MRVADVMRVVGEHGGPRAYVHRALGIEYARNPRTAGDLMDEVAACGGLHAFAAVIVADRLVLDLAGGPPVAADLSLALDHGHAQLVAVELDELAEWAQGTGAP